jgi:GNAT superfamily N-acetyltransferase
MAKQSPDRGEDMAMDGLRDGCHDLPHGKIGCIVTFLEMRAPPARRPAPARPDLALRRLGADDVILYKQIFRVIGERWLWFSRLAMATETLRHIIGDPAVEAHALLVKGEPAGLLELDFRKVGEAELTFFGLYEEAIGTGAGRWLMSQALDKAWSRPIARLFVHTCTRDHPGAIGFYRRSGFTPYKTALEIADDPRLTGLLPRDSLPDVPLME